jgi:anti-sigma regulatory factor (Ser/Thr protein kinase)
VRGFAIAAGCGDDIAASLALAVNEAVTNTLVHAYGAEGGILHLGIRRTRDGVAVDVRDEGRGDAVAARESQETGRGLTMVEALADRVEFRRDPHGATLHAVFRT